MFRGIEKTTNMQRHITDRVDFSKFGVPSWRIEQRFNTGVLIGNWSEERKAVCFDCHFGI